MELTGKFRKGNTLMKYTGKDGQGTPWNIITVRKCTRQEKARTIIWKLHGFRWKTNATMYGKHYQEPGTLRKLLIGRQNGEDNLTWNIEIGYTIRSDETVRGKLIGIRYSIGNLDW